MAVIYIIGYERDGQFITLHETKNIQLAQKLARHYKTKRKEAIKIKGRTTND